MLQDFPIQQYPLAVRQLAYEIVSTMLDTPHLRSGLFHPHTQHLRRNAWPFFPRHTELVTIAEPFIQALLGAIAGEKDPRLLRAVFRWHPTMAESPGFAEAQREKADVRCARPTCSRKCRVCAVVLMLVTSLRANSFFPPRTRCSLSSAHTVMSSPRFVSSLLCRSSSRL